MRGLNQMIPWAKKFSESISLYILVYFFTVKSGHEGRSIRFHVHSERMTGNSGRRVPGGKYQHHPTSLLDKWRVKINLSASQSSSSFEPGIGPTEKLFQCFQWKVSLLLHGRHPSLSDLRPRTKLIPRCDVPFSVNLTLLRVVFDLLCASPFT